MRAWVCFLMLCLAHGAAFADKAEQERKDIQKIEHDTLAKLYSVQPSAKGTIDGAAGYAVFSNFGMKILVAGSGSGKGVAVNRKTGQREGHQVLEGCGPEQELTEALPALRRSGPTAVLQWRVQPAATCAGRPHDTTARRSPGPPRRNAAAPPSTPRADSRCGSRTAC